jgi:hypothetical protein
MASDGTTAALQKNLTKTFIANFTVTEELKSQWVADAAKLGATLELSDLAGLEDVDRSAMTTNVNTNLGVIVSGFRLLASLTQSASLTNYSGGARLKRTGYPPASQECAEVRNIEQAAVITAAVAWYVPAVAAVFGLVAGSALLWQSLEGCD